MTTEGFVFCEICNTPCQRLMDPNTTPEDGLRKHMETVHPGFKVIDQ